MLHHAPGRQMALASHHRPPLPRLGLALWPALERIAVELTALLLEVRPDGCPPRDPYEAQLRKDVRRGHAKPVLMLLVLLVGALRDGAKLERAIAFVDRLGAVLRALAPEPPAGRVRPWRILHRLDFQLGGRQDVAQADAMAEDAPREALLALRETTAAELAHKQELLDAIDLRLYGALGAGAAA